MPWPNPYIGGQDDDQTRSVDNVHIEPSIREGLHLVSSLYGRDASRPLDRFAPVNTTQPFLVGSPQIPSRIVCEIGVWKASPTPDYFYQFMLDGVDIPGLDPTVNYVDTDETFDGKRLTCEVRADNGIGEDYAVTSNFIDCSLIEPIEIHEFEHYAIQGLEVDKVQTTTDDRTVILSGLGTDNRIDVNRAVAYFTTGTSADNRHDINAMNIFGITGLGQEDTMTVMERDLGVAAIWYDQDIPLVESVPYPLKLKNRDAELGEAGWTGFGQATWTDSNVITNPPGDWGFFGGIDVDPAQANTPYTYLRQDVPIEDGHIADVDAGLTNLEMYWLQNSLSGLDQGNIKVEFLADDQLTIISTMNGDGLYASPSGIWFARDWETPIPPGTRYVRVYLEFNWTNSGENLNAGIDTVRPYIRKGPKLQNRDFGPEFNEYRLRFTQQNTWSGGALAELEFLDQNQLDITNGGDATFGSAGLGVINADAAFDKIASNYWAGAQDSIAAGTSWVGYRKPGLWRPENFAITARPGSDALQVGYAWTIEGSNDGIRWTEIERFPQTRVTQTFNSGERKVFPIHRGNFDYAMDPTPPGAGIGYTTFGGDDYNQKGLLMQTLARIDLTHIRFGLMNQSHDYAWQICKINGQKSASWYFGMVEEVLAQGFGSHNDGGSPNGTTIWTEIALPETIELEVGDYFLVSYLDLGITTGNPNTVADGGNDPNQGRLNYFFDTGTSGDVLTEVFRPSGWLRKIEGWQRFTNGNNFYEVGNTNNGPFNSDSGYHFAIDIKGNFF